MRPNTIEDFWSRVRITPAGCWEWLGTKLPSGYGQFSLKGLNHYVHRMMYEMYKGTIPDGLEIDHLCRNPRCVRLDHLEAVTHSKNVQRGLAPQILRARARAKIHCKLGHPLNGLSKRGWRYCLTCCRRRDRVRQRRIRAGWTQAQRAYQREYMRQYRQRT